MLSRSWLVVLFVVGCSQGCSQRAPRKLELVDAPVTGDVAPLIAHERQRAVEDGRQLLVYVGASWCEPCQHFHEAAVAGQLDAAFGQLRVLVFDADRDDPALERAGYRSQMIPLFALPRPDGTASGKQFAGSIKGDGAVADITPRLQALLASPP
jgi:thiol-disulfide isomerase/thioredoxin